ncbi:YslB family protein [Virgibacillus halodenitrificans]|uniref:YslB family protein n=1 Tax=Virgibacillus halodenitrificans TaxID=1482 RepID=UPI001FB1F5E5|nr:YslB family protein [Virgibacillus halodenitrificans]MCJ0931680.1 YslB family protein [Virgibacillus halodenitrificans]
MSNNNTVFPISQLTDLQSSGAGYDILRYLGLPEILGTETNTLLYFLGRNLARKFEFNSMEDIAHLFEQLGWGYLEIVKEKKETIIFQLMSDAIVQRLKAPIDTEFRLEAGFLAEAYQRIDNSDCECTEEINSKLFLVQFTLHRV